MKKEPFFIVVMDHDRKAFSVHGPMLDDTSITEDVVAAQKSGREINCQTAPDGLTRDLIIQKCKEQYAYSYCQEYLASHQRGQRGGAV